MYGYEVPARSTATMRGGARLLAISLAAALGVAVAPASATAQQEEEAPLKVGVVNVDVVALQSPAGQALQQELAAFQEQVGTELQTREEAVRTLEARIAEADSLSVEETRALEREYQDVLTAFQRYRQDRQEEAAALQTQGQAAIREEIGPVLAAIQTELGYDLVLNSTSPIILFFSDRIDITQLAIDRLAASDPSGS